MWHKLKRIQSESHKAGTYNVCKIYLSCFEDKRFTLDDGLIVWLIFIMIQQVNEIGRS